MSHGIDGKLGSRNTPALFNLAWHRDFFWDGGVHDLDLFPISPIENPVEMDDQVTAIVAELSTDAQYPAMFRESFGSPDITSTRIFQALSVFMLSIISNQSRYDDFIAGNSGALTADEQAGMALFGEKCSGCHTGVLFSDFEFRNNGLRHTADYGKFRISLNPADSFKFKTPSLRNIDVSGPYMHDGRFATLERVLQHYATGVELSTTLDDRLISGSQLGIPMTAEEQQKIIAFLKSLTDQRMLRDPSLSEF